MKVSAEADQESVRAAFIEIVKLVHPDSGHPEASSEKFAEVDNAFRILQAKYAKERRGIKESSEAVRDQNIKVNAWHVKTVFQIIPLKIVFDYLNSIQRPSIDSS